MMIDFILRLGAALSLIFLFMGFGVMGGSCPSAASPTGNNSSRAMGVWNTEQLMESASGFEDLLAFASAEKVNNLVLQRVIETVGGRQVVYEPAKMRSLLATARRRGIHVHALDELAFNDGGSVIDRFDAFRLSELLPWCENSEEMASITYRRIATPRAIS